MADKQQKSSMELLREGYVNSVQKEESKLGNQEKIIELNKDKVDIDNPLYLLNKAYENNTKN